MKGIKQILIKILYILFVSFGFSNLIYSINLDDLREDPFDKIDRFDSIIYIKVGNSVCTGALINHRTILTAAHCMIEGKKAEIFIGNELLDSSTFRNTSSFVKLSEAKRYAGFNGASYDLALISLAEPLTEIKALKLNENIPDLNSVVFIAGFGLHGTGSEPDQKFDRKKRWGTNILSLIAKESLIVGQSQLSSSPDKTILGFYFDKDVSALESLISLGDSGGPLLIEVDGNLEIIGVASWVRAGRKLNRGYGASAGFASIEQNKDWIKFNNPLKEIKSNSDGDWSEGSNWNDSLYPNNYIPSSQDYNSSPARYYSVDIDNNINLSKKIKIDLLNILSLGNFTINKDSELAVLLSTQILQGSFTNNGTFITPYLFLNDGIFLNESIAQFSDQIDITKGKLVNNGSIETPFINLKKGTVSGEGNFITDKFLNNGTLSPGNESNSIGALSFSSLLENKGILIIDLDNSSSSDQINSNKFIIGGTLLLNPLSVRYSGNSKFKIMNFNEITGESFDEIKILKSNFGRLSQEILYGDKEINLVLINPNYSSLATTKISKSIGTHIDSFANITSSSFQELLDQINYIESNERLSGRLESLIPTNDYKYYLERIESFESPKAQGVFISESSFDVNIEQSSHESIINRLDLNYNGLNVAYLKMEADFSSETSRSYSDSDAVQINYEIPFNFLDIKLSLLRQDTQSETSRNLNIGSSLFQANFKRDFEIKKESIDFGKELNTYMGDIDMGLSYSSINLRIDPFSETLNGAINDYTFNDVDLKFFTPYFNYSKKVTSGLNKLRIGMDIKKPQYKKNIFKMSIRLDVSNDILSLDEEIGLSKDPLTTLYISNTYRESLFGKLSYSKKEGNEMIQLRIGYLL